MAGEYQVYLLTQFPAGQGGEAPGAPFLAESPGRVCVYLRHGIRAKKSSKALGKVEVVETMIAPAPLVPIDRVERESPGAADKIVQPTPFEGRHIGRVVQHFVPQRRLRGKPSVIAAVHERHAFHITVAIDLFADA